MGHTALDFTSVGSEPAGGQAGSAASLPLESPPSDPCLHRIPSLCCVEFWGSDVFASSSRFSDRPGRSCKELLSGGAGVRAGSEMRLTPLTLGPRLRSPRACSPHTLGPNAFKVRGTRCSLIAGTKNGDNSDSLLLVGDAISPPTLRASAAFFLGWGGWSGSNVFQLPSDGLPAPTPGVERGTEKRPKGSLDQKPLGLLVLRCSLCRLCFTAQLPPPPPRR